MLFAMNEERRTEFHGWMNRTRRKFRDHESRSDRSVVSLAWVSLAHGNGNGNGKSELCNGLLFAWNTYPRSYGLAFAFTKKENLAWLGLGVNEY